MVQQLDPKLGELDITLASIKMQAAQLNAEVGFANLLIGEATYLQHLYNEQIQGVQDIYTAHTTNHMFSIHITMHVGYGEAPVTKTYYFNDPGLPPPSVTGTKAEEFTDQTQSTARVYDQYMTATQNSFQSLMQSAQSNMEQMSNNQKGTVQFAGTAIQVMEYAMNLIQSVLS